MEQAVVRTHPIVLGARAQLLGVLAAPSGAPGRDLGVVVCPPLGHQNVCTYRPLRTLADRIAAKGVPVLRFDWPGCGDSGDIPDGERDLDVWLGSIDQAISSLRSATGVSEIALLGLRIGATFAAIEASRHPAVSRAVLLAPYAGGRAYLRELAALEALVAQTYYSPASSTPPELPEHSLEAGGFLISAEERRALEEADLQRTGLGSCPPERVLVLDTHTGGPLEGLAGHLTEEGAGVDFRVVPELAHAWESSQQSYLPAAVGELVTDWILDELPMVSRQTPPPAVDGSETATLEAGAVREHSRLIEGTRGRLFVVTSTPAEAEPNGNWVVFLNTGRIRRSGTSRLWTQWARAWASRGIPSLRLDVLGVGDSDGAALGDESLFLDVSIAYAPELLTDIADAIEWLAHDHGATRLNLIGLCSGATMAYQTALRDPRVVGIGMVNPPAFFWDTRLPLVRAWNEAWAAGLDPRSIVSSVRRRGRPWVGKVVSGRIATLPGRKTDVWHRAELRRSLEQVRASGTTISAIYTDRDYGLRYLDQAIGRDFRSELARFGVGIEVVEGPDHTFRPLWSQAVLRGYIEELLAATGFLEHAEPASTGMPPAH